jgi:hypothetical protein
LLASELGANAGNWDENGRRFAFGVAGHAFHGSAGARLPRKPEERGVLPEEAYASFFTDGKIPDSLARDLIGRYQAKRAAGHWVPDLEEF